jgi:hypothetical protein
MTIECSNFQSVLELAAQNIPPRIVNPLPELCDPMVHRDVQHHLHGKQARVGAGARPFPFPG